MAEAIQAGGSSLADVERCGADVNSWLASRGYDRAVAKGLIDSFVEAEYPPSEWVSSLEEMTQEEIKALTGAVQAKRMAALGAAYVHYLNKDYAAARPAYEELLAAHQRTLGAEHQTTQGIAKVVLSIYRALGGYDTEVAELQGVYKISDGRPTPQDF